MATRFPFGQLMRRRFVALLCRTTAVLTLVVPLQSMAALALDSQPGNAEQEMDEVIVEGSPLWKLRRDIRETEDRFYARYNQLNANDEFDVHCGEQAPLGTRLRTNRCRIAFLQKVEEQVAHAYITGLQDAMVNGVQGHMTESMAVDADSVFLERRDEYRKQALAVINGDADLRRLVRIREDLGKRYQKARTDYFKDKWLRW